MSTNLSNFLGATLLWHWFFMFSETMDTNLFSTFLLTCLLGGVSAFAISKCEVKAYDFNKKEENK